MRNPFAAYPMSQGWRAGHEAVDYATPVGVAFTSPASGIYVHRPSELAWKPGMAGHHGDLYLDDGRRIRVCHLDRHIAPHGSLVVEGVTILAVTGNSGYVLPRPSPASPNNGAHMHTTGFHPDGTRWNWTLEAQGDNMPLDAEDRKWLNGMGQSIIDQIAVKLQPRPEIDYDKLADAIVRRVITGS